MPALDCILTNDDGIHAPGLDALREGLPWRSRALVVAPSGQRSAVAHSITIHHPIACDPVRYPDGRRGWSVDGTPADAVKLGIQELASSPPRFVLSGINYGANLGVNVFYSGTVAAAREACFAGIPSFALSLCTKSAPRWRDASAWAWRVVTELSALVAGQPLCLNVNIPNLPYDEVKGILFTCQAHTPYADRFHRRRDPRGRLYFWMDGDRTLAGREARNGRLTSDIAAVRDGYVSVTPLRLTLTCDLSVARLGAGGRVPKGGNARARRTPGR
jgi:5'-nucleotidase